MSNFNVFRDKLVENYNKNVVGHTLFSTDVDKDEMYALYLDSYPAGTNEVYRKRREHDCSCCRHFIKEIGGVVWIDDDLNVHSLWEFDISDPTYRPVAASMDAYVKRHSITDQYLYNYDNRNIGNIETFELVDIAKGQVNKWQHFYLPIASEHRVAKRGNKSAEIAVYRTEKELLNRSLNDISMSALDTVLDLIEDNVLYRGAEWENSLVKFKELKKEYQEIQNNPVKLDRFCWLKAGAVGPVISRLRNHSMGVLLTDISNGKPIEDAVKLYESIVAPLNYKRPKPIFTKKMLEEAQKKVEELGYMDSLPRRFANADDISPADMIFVNRDDEKPSAAIVRNVFDQMAEDVIVNPKDYSRAQEISVDDFIAAVLPKAVEADILFENRHRSNLMSLIAPVNKNAKSMFKWKNGFSWVYDGNIADSDIRRNVQAAGGKTEGCLRFSIQWNDICDWDQNDLDAHCEIGSSVPVFNRHIYFAEMIDLTTGGNLDVDIRYPVKGRPAVENIIFPYMNRMVPGNYKFFVQDYAFRGGMSGFRAEIEVNGEIHRYNYNHKVVDDVVVAIVNLDKNGVFTIRSVLPDDMSSTDIWGVKTMRWTPIRMAMLSPNYWYWAGEDRIGNLHYFFMLKGMQNPGRPNGFFNEFLNNELMPHRRVFEALGKKMAVEEDANQLSGLGFSSTRHTDFIVRLKENKDWQWKTYRVKI